MSDTKQQKLRAGLVVCEEIRSQLPSYMLRELGDKQSRLVHEHLRVCDGCRNEAAQFERMHMLLREQPFVAEAGGAVLSEKRIKRLRFTAMHPICDWIYYRHRVVSSMCAIALILLVLFLLRNFGIFREQPLEDSIPVWQMFRSDPLPEQLERSIDGAEEGP